MNKADKKFWDKCSKEEKEFILKRAAILGMKETKAQIIEDRNMKKSKSKKKKSLGNPQDNRVNISVSSKKDFVLGFLSAVGVLGLYAGWEIIKKRNKCKGEVVTKVTSPSTASGTETKTIEVVTKVADPSEVPVLKEDQAAKVALWIREATYVIGMASLTDGFPLLLQALKIMQNAADYKLVNKKFMEIDTVQPINGQYNLSIAKKLLGTYIQASDMWKYQIELEYKRLGLKDYSGERLSGTLSGLSGGVGVITIAPLIASFPNMTAGQPFPKGMDLGKEIERNNGVVTVLTYNDKVMYVPAESII